MPRARRLARDPRDTSQWQRGEPCEAVGARNDRQDEEKRHEEERQFSDDLSLGVPLFLAVSRSDLDLCLYS